MAELRFKVKADYEELGRLRAEIQKLKADLKNTGKNTDTEAVKSMESQLAMLTKQYEAMTKRIAEAEAQYDMLAKKMTERAKDVAKAQQVISDAAANPPAPDTAELPATDTSLETQAKAYDDLKKEIDSIAGSKANLIKQMLDEQNAIRLINAELKQINVEQKTNGKQTQAQKERVTQLNESLLTHKQALSEVRQSLTNYVKLENAASGSMEELSQSLGRMRMVYRTLTEEERNSPFGKELLASIQQADAKIKELDATIGNHQRNVGNYGQAWNGLGNSIQQLARELPALANGPRVFFSAISNNLPILADEIKRARTEYDEMVKKGEKGVPVWKQIGASIFSWQTALTVGITLLTMYGDEIVEWGKKMIQGSNSAITAKKAIKELNESMVEGAKQAGKTIAELKVMETAARDTAKSDMERDAAAAKVLETLGKTATATDILKVKTGGYRTEIELTTEALIRQAQAQGAMAKIDEQTSKVLEAQSKLEARRREGVTKRDERQARRLSTAGAELTGEDVFSAKVSSLQADYDKAKADLEVLVKEFNNTFTSGLLNEETAAEAQNRLRDAMENVNRITQMEKDLMRDRAREVKNMQFSVEQARIDAMAEGYVRTKAQRELNEKKEIEDLNRQKEDYIRRVAEQEKAIFDAREDQMAQQDRNYVKKTFDLESAIADISRTDPVVAQYASAIEYTRRQYAKEAIKHEKQWQKERVEQARDLELMVDDARIDAMKDGYAKQRALRDLEYRRELESLERQKNDYVEKMVELERTAFEAQEDERAKNIQGYQRKEFDVEVSKANVDTSAYDAAMEYASEKYVQRENEAIKKLYDQYKSYEDSKLDLEKSYQEDVLELNNEYLITGDEKYLRSINERSKAYIQALNKLESEFDTADYKLIFGDPERMTSSTIDKALEAARKKIAQLDKEADPETFQALSEAIARLEDARDNNPFQGWETSVMGLIQKLFQIRNIRKDIAEYEKQGNTEAANAAKGQLERSKKDLSRAILGTGVAQFGDALSSAAASMKEVAKASGDIHLEEQAEALESAAGFVSSVASGAASGGWVGAIVGGATSLMNMLIASITETEVVASNAKKAFDEYLDELAHKARTINEDDYETIFGVRTLRKVVDASREAKKAFENYEELYDNPKYKGFWQKGKDWVDETDLQSMIVFEGKKQNAKNALASKTLAERFEGLFDATTGKLNLEKAQAILKAYSQYSGENWYQALKDATEALQDYEDNLKIVDDYLASLFSDVGDEIVDAIMKGEDALEVLERSAGDIFASIAKQMITELMISQDFIDKYKEKMRNAMATEGMTDDADVLTEMADELEIRIAQAQDAWAEIQRIAQDKGIEMSLGGSDSQQTASRRGYETISEDTATELVGRAIAQYESNLRMEATMAEVRDMVSLLVDAKTAGAESTLRDIALESRQIIADSYLELQQIRENTGAIIKPIREMNNKMDKIISGL